MIDQEKKTIHRRILLLGGTGAMGEHLTRILAEQGDDVHVTTRSCRMSEITFINDLLRESWDAIVDFMVYNTDEFRVRVSQLLKATKQYIFISSARVYGPTNSSDELINEETPRLLDMIKDEEYQKPDRRIFFTRQAVIIGLLSDPISLLVKHGFSLGYLKRRIGFGVL